MYHVYRGLYLVKVSHNKHVDIRIPNMKDPKQINRLEKWKWQIGN